MGSFKEYAATDRLIQSGETVVEIFTRSFCTDGTHSSKRGCYAYDESVVLSILNSVAQDKQFIKYRLQLEDFAVAVTEKVRGQSYLSEREFYQTVRSVVADARALDFSLEFAIKAGLISRREQDRLLREAGLPAKRIETFSASLEELHRLAREGATA
jgi:hypothetical protein